MLKFLTPRCDVINPKMDQKRPNWRFMLIERLKSKVKSYFEVNYSFMKPFSQNFEVLTQLDDIINPTLAHKRAPTHISCTEVILDTFSYGSFS